MRLAAFFHVWAYGNWSEPLFEFAQALRRVRPDYVYFGVIASSHHPEGSWSTANVLRAAGGAGHRAVEALEDSAVAMS